MSRILFQKNHIVAALLALILGLTGCGKSGKVKWMYYDETNCADKWEFTNNNEKLKSNVVAYMESKGVTIYEIEIFRQQPAESCTECSCRTGRQYKCKVKKGDAKAAASEGFKE